jgi:protein SCO1/2
LTVLALLTMTVYAGITQSQNETPAQDHHEHHKQMSRGAAQTGPAPLPRLAIPDTEVFDQNGKRLNFYTDLVKGKVVAINFIFTTCTTICPPLGATFASVGALGGARFGADFHLISISVDPTTDTPQRLKAWSDKFAAKPGWTLVTGQKEEIDHLLKALGGFSASVRDHSPTVLVINDAQGVWTRAYGLAPPAKLLSVIDEAGKGIPVGSTSHEEEKR